jgi:hypothetical protein
MFQTRSFQGFSKYLNDVDEPFNGHPQAAKVEMLQWELLEREK